MPPFNPSPSFIHLLPSLALHGLPQDACARTHARYVRGHASLAARGCQPKVLGARGAAGELLCEIWCQFVGYGSGGTHDVHIVIA